MIYQYYVTDKESADRATKSELDQTPIDISGTVGDKVKFFRGVVKRVEEDKINKRWRITIREGE